MGERPYRIPVPAVQPPEWQAPAPGSEASDEAFSAAGATDRGRHRENNEDAFAVAPLAGSHGTLLVVADGLGGAHGGEVASRSVVETLVQALADRELPADRTPRQALREAIELANEALRRQAQDDPSLAEFGTTVTAALVLGGDVWLAHVGDSRAYHWSRGHLEQVTRDHTMAQRLREEGLVGKTQRVPSWESVLWNALGPSGEEPQIEERHLRLEPGARLLLCSDGLTRHIGNPQLARVLAKRDEPAALCRELIEAANRAGGEDNITAVVARANRR